MSILGIDVGITTGYALLDDDGVFEMTGTVHVEDLPLSMLAVWSYDTNMQVCIEYPQENIVSGTPELRRAVAQVLQFYPHAHVVRPGVWKSSAIAARPMPPEIASKVSKHERDAVNIARWYAEHAHVSRH
jgi:ASC-1-like (ASCH) protein